MLKLDQAEELLTVLKCVGECATEDRIDGRQVSSIKR